MRNNSAKYGSELAFIDDLLGTTKDIRTQAASVNLDKNALDVSKIKVPAELYEEFTGRKPVSAPTQKDIQKLEESSKPKVTTKPKTIKESSSPMFLTEETGQELLSSLLEIKEILAEMCSVGMGGVNMAPSEPEDSKKKKKTNQRLLLDRIKKRAKR